MSQNKNIVVFSINIARYAHCMYREILVQNCVNPTLNAFELRSNLSCISLRDFNTEKSRKVHCTGFLLHDNAFSVWQMITRAVTCLGRETHFFHLNRVEKGLFPHDTAHFCCGLRKNSFGICNFISDVNIRLLGRQAGSEYSCILMNIALYLCPP